MKKFLHKFSFFKDKETSEPNSKHTRRINEF